MIAVLANASHPFGGMIADLVMIAAALFAGYGFSAGVRCEARESDRGLRLPVLAGFAISLALALLLELTVGDDAQRALILRLLIGAEFLSALLWIPQLLRGHVPKPATAAVAVLAALIALAVVTQSFVPAAILFGVVALLVFAVSRARVAGVRH